MNKEWSDQYKHPRWQKRRLERLESADWVCEYCDAQDKQLHVHHHQYFKGRKVWEYSDDELVVLCDACHVAAHELQDLIKAELAIADQYRHEQILGFLHGANSDNVEFVKLRGYEHAWGLAIFYGLSPEEVVALETDGRVTFQALWNASLDKIEKAKKQ